MSDQVPFAQSVLHTTDFTPASHRAFAHALAIAFLRQAELTLLHCGPESSEEVDWQAYPSVRETLVNWGLLEPGSPKSVLWQRFHMDVLKHSVKSRHPVLATANFLRDFPHDLVVLATEGRHGFRRWVEHSTAEAIARWSTANVLFVPSGARRGLIDLDTGAFSFANVLVAVDHTPAPARAVEYACRAAELLGDAPVTITVLHVGDTLPDLPAMDDGDRWHWQVERIDGDPKTVILQRARVLRADLVVMTTAGVDSILDVFRGNTSEQVVRESECPVLVVGSDAQGAA